MKTFEEVDVVMLRHDLPEHDLSAGDLGAVVHVYRGGAAYEVEFVEESGYTRALLTLEPDMLEAYTAKREAAE